MGKTEGRADGAGGPDHCLVPDLPDGGSQGLFQSKAELFTYLTDANALASGSPVTLAGVDIGGKVESVELNPGSNDAAKTVKVTLQIPSKYLSSIPLDSQTKMASANLLGTYYINIQRGKSPQTVQSGAVLPSTQTAEIADLFQQSSQTLGTLDSVVDKINAIVADIQAGKGSIGELLVDDTIAKNFVDIENQFKQLSSDLHNTITSSDNSLGKLLNDKGALYDDVHNGLDSVDKSLAGVNKIVDGVNSGQGTLGQLVQNPAMYDDFRQILGDVHTLLAGIQAGQGTAGKLLKTDEFGDQIKATLGKVDTLLDKMSNGSGTVARLLNDPSLFDDLDATTRESQRTAQGFPRQSQKIPAHQDEHFLDAHFLGRAVRSLAVNADDFGFTRDVNRGIVEAHLQGILTSTTLMATGPAFDDAVRLAKEHPTLDIGCHLVLVGEPPIPPTVAKLIQAVALKRLRVYDELAAQVRRILDAGLAPDPSGHPQAHPPAAAGPGCRGAPVPGVSHSLGAPSLRLPASARRDRLEPARRQSCIRRRAHAPERVLRAHGCRFTDHFAGFQLTGHYNAATLAGSDSLPARGFHRIHVPPRPLRE